jgi:hypothetical protein
MGFPNCETAPDAVVKASGAASWSRREARFFVHH